MNSRKLRVFYRKADNEIVWTHDLINASGEEAVFRVSQKEDLADIPNKMPDGKSPLGGSPDDYACVEIAGEAQVDAYMNTDDRSIVGGKLIMGEPRPPKPPPRNLLLEVDKLTARLAKLEAKE